MTVDVVAAVVAAVGVGREVVMTVFEESIDVLEHLGLDSSQCPDLLCLFLHLDLP